MGRERKLWSSMRMQKGGAHVFIPKTLLDEIIRDSRMKYEPGDKLVFRRRATRSTTKDAKVIIEIRRVKDTDPEELKI